MVLLWFVIDELFFFVFRMNNFILIYRVYLVCKLKHYFINKINHCV